MKNKKTRWRTLRSFSCWTLDARVQKLIDLREDKKDQGRKKSPGWSGETGVSGQTGVSGVRRVRGDRGVRGNRGVKQDRETGGMEESLT